MSDSWKPRTGPTCSTCQHFAALSPGHAAICFEQWKGLPWNAAVPLTTKDGWCDKHADKPAKAVGEVL